MIPTAIHKTGTLTACEVVKYRRKGVRRPAAGVITKLVCIVVGLAAICMIVDGQDF
ncbi:MAG TPA: hypothetical protein VK436_13600 [Methanocella sp.]|nr:hypothetical protein [Methanocella sp.]